MRDYTKIAKIVRATLAKDFKLKVLDVRVSEGEETTDDTMLHIDVIFDGTPKDVDARKLSGAVRHIRPKLNAIGEKAFPVFSFISKGDIGAGKFEAA
jgi:hypothetical protein